MFAVGVDELAKTLAIGGRRAGHGGDQEQARLSHQEARRMRLGGEIGARPVALERSADSGGAVQRRAQPRQRPDHPGAPEIQRGEVLVLADIVERVAWPQPVHLRPLGIRHDLRKRPPRDLRVPRGIGERLVLVGAPQVHARSGLPSPACSPPSPSGTPYSSTPS